MADRPEGRAWLAMEAAAAGLALGALLFWASTCLVGSFRPQDLADPYWRGIPGLRTDTSGFAAFIVAAICLVTSEYLRLRRVRQGRWARQRPPAAPAGTVAGGGEAARGATAGGATAGAVAGPREAGGEPLLPSMAAPGTPALLALAASETVAVLATGLFGYLSVNAVTHPVTLGIQATHLLSWPTEGTLRVVALLLCVASFGTIRYLRPAVAAAR